MVTRLAPRHPEPRPFDAPTDLLAAHARAGALRARVDVALERAAALQAAATALHAVCRDTRTNAGALRALGAARRGGRWGAPATTRPADWPASGRVVRRRAGRRQAAAMESVPPPERWASATVYAVRTIPGPPDGAAAGAAFHDPTRAQWTIRELDTRQLPGSRGARCLVFENHEVVRRVWSYPAAWAALPAVALLRLAELAS